MTHVVVPVFNAPQSLQRCVDALAATLEDDRPVTLIDDASDDPAVAGILAAAPAHWQRVVHPVNRGFVATANHGMRLAGDDDVVLLNADTRPGAGWLEAIERCAASDRDIASITPLTNNGEIASIPEFCRANPCPDDPGRWARACREAGRPGYPAVPTAVGFCMYLRRRCLAAIGDFDEAAFGRGYGEENDWCLRASAAGWKHVLCDDAYVAHEGGASFGPLGLAPGGEAMQTLIERYPDYPRLIEAFIESDPVAERRRAIVARYRELAAPARDRLR